MVRLRNRTIYVRESFLQLRVDPGSRRPAACPGKGLRRVHARFFHQIHIVLALERNTSLKQKNSAAIVAHEIQGALRILQVVEQPVAMNDVKRSSLDRLGALEVHSDNIFCGISRAKHGYILRPRFCDRYLAAAVNIIRSVIPNTSSQFQHSLARDGDSQTREMLEPPRRVTQIMVRVKRFDGRARLDGVCRSFTPDLVTEYSHDSTRGFLHNSRSLTETPELRRCYLLLTELILLGAPHCFTMKQFSYCGLCFNGLPIASRKMALFPSA